MNKVERTMIESLARSVEANGCGMTEEEAKASIVPRDHPELRHRPAYKHCFQRLRIRDMIDGEIDGEGRQRYRPSEKALTEIRSNGPEE